jgi:hypothetical protein
VEERLSAASKFKPRCYLTASSLWLRYLAALGEAIGIGFPFGIEAGVLMQVGAAMPAFARP